jgi:hypothetical protein
MALHCRLSRTLLSTIIGRPFKLFRELSPQHPGGREGPSRRQPAPGNGQVSNRKRAATKPISHLESIRQCQKRPKTKPTEAKPSPRLWTFQISCRSIVVSAITLFLHPLSNIGVRGILQHAADDELRRGVVLPSRRPDLGWPTPPFICRNLPPNPAFSRLGALRLRGEA